MLPHRESEDAFDGMVRRALGRYGPPPDFAERVMEEIHRRADPRDGVSRLGRRGARHRCGRRSERAMGSKHVSISMARFSR